MQTRKKELAQPKGIRDCWELISAAELILSGFILATWAGPEAIAEPLPEPGEASLGVGSTTIERAYVANLNADNVSVIDLTSNAVVKTISVGDAPRSVAATEDGSRVFVLNGRDQSLSVIDPEADTVVQTLDIRTMPGIPGTGFEPAEIVASPDGKKVYVAGAYYDVLIVDVASGGVQFLSEQLGLEPYGLFVNRMIDISPVGGFLFTHQFNGISSGIIKINTDSLQNEGDFSAPASAFMVTDDGTTLFTRYIGLASVVHIDSFIVDEIDFSDAKIYFDPISDLDFPEPMTVSPDHRTVYVVAKNFTSYNPAVPFSSDTPVVVAFDLLDWQVLGVVPIAQKPAGIDITSDGKRLVVPITTQNRVTIIDTQTLTVVSDVPVGPTPRALKRFIISRPLEPPPPRFAHHKLPIFRTTAEQVEVVLAVEGDPEGLTVEFSTDLTPGSWVPVEATIQGNTLVVPASEEETGFWRLVR